MKQTLQLKLSQHLTLTPQLQQSIRLLQLSTLELNAEVDRLLQENPLLEKADDDEAAPADGALSGAVPAPERDARDERVERVEREPERAQEAVDTVDGVDRADFEDYSSGDSDWGGGAGSSSTARSRCGRWCCARSRRCWTCTSRRSRA